MDIVLDFVVNNWIGIIAFFALAPIASALVAAIIYGIIIAVALSAGFVADKFFL